MNSTLIPPQESHPKTAGAWLHWLSGMALLFLLAGYVLTNRTFAKLGHPPFYVGEIMLALGLFAALFQLKHVFVAALPRSRPMIWIALFTLYGVLRIGIDSTSRGMDAARDGVICTYALFAFVGPWALSACGAQRRLLSVFGCVLTFAALLYAGGIYRGWIAAFPDVKADFLALAAGLALSIWLCLALYQAGSAVRPEPRAMSRPGEAPTKLAAPAAKSFGARLRSACTRLTGLVALSALLLLYALPTRALWPLPLVLALLIVLAQGLSKRNAKLLGAFAAASVLALALILPLLPSAREKAAALFDSEDSHFSTVEGQHAAHSVKWRLIFWRRCITETAQRAPLFGLGFGINLTDLLRDTPDWPIFEDSQNAAKYGAPNRHPHSAHVSVLTRLGALGFCLWLGILGSTFTRGLTNCRETREQRAGFWFETALLCCWSAYVLAMTFGVVLESPFGGIPFWTLSGLIAQPRFRAA